MFNFGFEFELLNSLGGTQVPRNSGTQVSICYWAAIYYQVTILLRVALPLG
jgi:hypothetical protein